MCKCCAKRGVRAAGRGRGRIVASGSARGTAAVPGRSSVEARGGPDLRISDLYRGYVDPFGAPTGFAREQARRCEQRVRRCRDPPSSASFGDVGPTRPTTTTCSTTWSMRLGTLGPSRAAYRLTAWSADDRVPWRDRGRPSDSR
eukprot:3529231-Prymnesium_polylepis.1